LMQSIVFSLKPRRSSDDLQIWHVHPVKGDEAVVMVERDAAAAAHATPLRPSISRLLQLVEEERDRIIPAGPETLARLRELGHRLAS
jgi:hypothetical protein